MFPAFYTLFSSLIFIGLALTRFIGDISVQNSTAHRAFTYVTLALFGILSIASVIIIVGINLDDKKTFTTWITIVLLDLMVISSLLTWVLFENIRAHKKVQNWEYFLLVAHIINFMISLYSVFSVITHYKKKVMAVDPLHRQSSHVAIISNEVVRGNSSMSINYTLDDEAFPRPSGTSIIQAPPYSERVRNGASIEYHEERPPAYSTLPRNWHENTTDITASVVASFMSSFERTTNHPPAYNQIYPQEVPSIIRCNSRNFNDNQLENSQSNTHFVSIHSESTYL